MRLVHQIKVATAEALLQLYEQVLKPEDILVNVTKPEFTGDYTVVLFAMVKSLKTSPDALGQALGSQLGSQYPHLFQSFNIIKGFLATNLIIEKSTDIFCALRIHQSVLDITMIKEFCSKIGKRFVSIQATFN